MSTQHITSLVQNPYSHKVTDKIDSLDDIKLDWQVQKQPMVALLDGKYPTPIESHMSVHRSDNNQGLGIVGKGYECIQNTQLWDGLNRSLDGVDYHICGGGYLNDGGTVFIQAKVGDDVNTVNGDKFNDYLTFYSSHDGSSALTMYDTSVRIICQNTIGSSFTKGGKQVKLRVRHTRNASIQFDNLLSHIEAMFKHRQTVYAEMQGLTVNSMQHNQMIEWATSFFNKANKLSSVSSNKAHESVRLAKNGIGNRGETAYDMLNGVTELLTHGNRTAKNAEKTYKSSEFGTHAQYKANALADLSDRATALRHIERGRQLIRHGEAITA